MIPATAEADRALLRARLVAHLPTRRWRTRFAPAPTGHLHLGHAVNAVYVWSIARAFGGDVVVRFEDHDQQRSRVAYVEKILDDLSWLGLHGDNANLGFPDLLRQSAEPQAYAEQLQHLQEIGVTYACQCSRKTIGAGLDPGHERPYPGTCRDAGVPPGATAARRLRFGSESVTFSDVRHGPQTQTPLEQCGDLLLRDRLGQWTYQYSVVVDDLRQGIDVVVRGDDLLASTGRQLLLARALERDFSPVYLHHPLILRPDGTKLSKSTGDTSLAELRAAGWSSERVLGHAAWLGGLQQADVPVTTDSLADLWRE